MKLAHFYDSVMKLDPAALANAKSHDHGQRIELAKLIVRHLRAEYDRLEGYEKNFSPSFEDEKDDAQSLEVLRSIQQMFEEWANAAEPVYDTVKQIRGARELIPELVELRNNVGFARVRLVGTPEEELDGVRQARRGKCIPLEELRSELRARGHA
jgi:hypothetical protein